MTLAMAVQAALMHSGRSWEDLVTRATDVVLFGSRAVGVEKGDSDWDLLCIGSGPAREPGSVDLIWIGEQATLSRAWLGCELASHVAAYGIPLLGACAWMPNVHIAPEAAQRKRVRARGRIVSMSRVWSALRPSFQAKQAVLLRRELQRAELLDGGNAVPPAAILDARWKDTTSQPARLHALTSWCSVDEASAAASICTSEVRPRRSAHSQ